MNPHPLTPWPTALAGAAVALLAAATVASCGGAARGKATRPTPTTAPLVDPGNASPEVVRWRIETLDREIEAQSLSIARAPALAVEPGTTMADPGTSPVSPPSGDSQTCERSPRPVCQDVCSLSDSICDAADEICKLAEALPGDDWAAGRCTAGKDSCARARERCCGC